MKQIIFLLYFLVILFSSCTKDNITKDISKVNEYSQINFLASQDDIINVIHYSKDIMATIENAVNIYGSSHIIELLNGINNDQATEQQISFLISLMGFSEKKEFEE